MKSAAPTLTDIPDHLDRFPGSSIALERWLCHVKLRGRKFRVGLMNETEVGGLCEDRDDTRGVPKIFISTNEDDPMAVALHECLHGWFGRRLKEAEVDELTQDLVLALQAIQDKLPKPKRKR